VPEVRAIDVAVHLDRRMPKLESTCSPTNAGSIGFVKLGHPVPLSNLSRLSKRAVSLHTVKVHAVAVISAVLAF
jgi:hypothetical protein